ncbi:MAG: phosphate-starvation-inducible PsiE family protein [Elainella sp.]
MRYPWRHLNRKLAEAGKDDIFLNLAHGLENLAAKILVVALSAVILISLFDLIVLLIRDLIADPIGFFDKTLIDIFGLFLNILIALELLENITAYLKKHIVQVELVIVTSLIAVARKIIIFDFTKYTNMDLLALGVAILALSISYLLIKSMNRSMKDPHDKH